MRKALVIAVALVAVAVPAVATATPTAVKPTVISINVVNGRPVGGIKTSLREEGPDGPHRRSHERRHRVHLHGYDIEKTPEKGVPTVIQFVAKVPGRFELELHRPDVLLAQLTVRP